jgi:hypothetical protein
MKKYAIGFLTTYYLDVDLKVVAMKKGAPNQLPRKMPIKDCIKIYFDSYNDDLSNLLTQSNIKKD